MSRRARETDFPIGKLTRIKDILPPLEKLVMPEETVKGRRLARRGK